MYGVCEVSSQEFIRELNICVSDITHVRKGHEISSCGNKLHHGFTNSNYKVAFHSNQVGKY